MEAELEWIDKLEIYLVGRDEAPIYMSEDHEWQMEGDRSHRTYAIRTIDVYTFQEYEKWIYKDDPQLTHTQINKKLNDNLEAIIVQVELPDNIIKLSELEIRI